MAATVTVNSRGRCIDAASVRRRRLDASEVFLRELRSCPTFSREEEAELVRRRDAGDREAMDLLVRSVLPWTYRVASRQFPNDLEEAARAAMKAAWFAARKLDPTKGRITTYAHLAARREAEIQRHRFSSAVTLPCVTSERTTAEYREAYRKAKYSRSLNKALGDRDDALGDMLASHDPTPSDQAATNEEHRQRQEWVGWILRKMQPTYSAILRQRMRDEILEEIGSAQGISRERIRQLEVKAHASFRRWAERFPLLTFIRKSTMNISPSNNPPTRLLDTVTLDAANSKKTLSECIDAITSASADEITGEEEILLEEIADLKRQIERRLGTIKLLRRFRGEASTDGKKGTIHEMIHALLKEKGPMEATAIAAALNRSRASCYAAMKNHQELFRQEGRGTWSAIK